MKKLYLIAVTLLLSFTIVLAQEKQEKIGDTPQLNKVSKQVNADQTNGAIKVNSTAAVATYDFTTGSGQYYGGTDAAVEVEGGVWAMIAGDPNGNGAINATDYLVVKPNIGAGGYQKSDVNLNGAVNATDYLFIKDNVGRSSSVPSFKNT